MRIIVIGEAGLMENLMGMGMRSMDKVNFIKENSGMGLSMERGFMLMNN